MTHDQATELLGAYVLNAVDDDEGSAIAEHVADCPRCAAEVDDHLEIAAIFSSGGPAPDAVWQRIEAEIADDAPAISMFEAPAAQRRRHNRVMVMTGMAAAAAVVLFALLGATVIDQRNRLDDLSGQVASAQTAGDLSALLREPTTTVTELTSADGELVSRAVLGGDGDSYLIGDDLPDLPAGQTYQLWALLGDTPVSVGLLGRDPSLEPFHVDGPVLVLMITREPAGGVDAPTSDPLLSGEVT